MSKSGDDDWLEAVYTIGIILLAIPTLLGIPIILYGMLTPGGFGVDSGVYAIGSMQASGLIALVYAAIKMRRKKRSDKTQFIKAKN